jgi:UDP-glucose 4-epimerase
VVDTFIANGHEVVVVDDLSTGRRSNLNPAATFYQIDIRSDDLSEVFEKEKPQVVDHHAAQMDVRRSVVDPLFDADVNVLGSIKLIELSREHGVERFIYISTGGAVYGEPEYLPCDEAHPINPICPYGASKHTVEHYLYMYHELYGLDYVVLRYPNVYGPRQDPHGEAGVVAIFTGLMLKGDQVVINGDGDQERDFVFVGDCARANLLALTTQNSNTIFNLGEGKPTTVNDVYRELKDITDYPLSAVHGPAKVGETRRIYLEAKKAAQELDWQPSVGLGEGLTATVEYFKDAEPEV